MSTKNVVSYITIDEARIDEVCNAYFKWKDVNTYIKQNNGRGINMPDVLSEPIGCYVFGYKWNRGKIVGDATDEQTGRKIEFKASSGEQGDLSSFGPACKFDNLIFLRFILDTNMVYLYDLHINSEEMKNVPVNNFETFYDQQKDGRRPRLSLQKSFVKEKGLKPDFIFDIRKIKIIKPNTEEYNKILKL